MTFNPATDFDLAFQGWFTGFQAIYNNYMVSQFPTNTREIFEAKKGKRYIKIVKKLPGDKHGSVSAFIDLLNGDVLKAAGYNAPAKHARGNIFDDSNGLAKMGPYGPAYLK